MWFVCVSVMYCATGFSCGPNLPKPTQLDLSFSTLLTYQVWTGTSASGTSSPGPSAVARWRWYDCGVASSGGACCAPFPTRCWCWGASGWGKARSLADAAGRAGADARGPRLKKMTPGGGEGAAVWSLRGGGRHVVTRSLEEQSQCVRWQRNAIKCTTGKKNDHCEFLVSSFVPLSHVSSLSTACNYLDRFIFNCPVFAVKSVLLLTFSM